MTKDPIQRGDGREADGLRLVRFKKNIAPAATGSVKIAVGNTQVICAVSVDNGVPRWMREQQVVGGWVTAEYSMLPYSTDTRTRRESSAGKIGGRTQEIQRLIGRSLRAVINPKALGQRTFWVDCDVIQADGGTRTAAITGGFVALRLAVDRLLKQGVLDADPIQEAVAAVSVGMFHGQPLLDLCYEEDVGAEVDMNVVMTASGKFVEVQGTAEENPFSKSDLQKMLAVAQKGIDELIAAQAEVTGA